MAKKKATRKGARGARKATARRSPRKAASRQRESPRQINLKGLQAIIKTKIKKLESYPPSPKVDETLKLMGDMQTALSNACATSPIPMVIDF